MDNDVLILNYKLLGLVNLDIPVEFRYVEYYYSSYNSIKTGRFTLETAEEFARTRSRVKTDSICGCIVAVSVVKGNQDFWFTKCEDHPCIKVVEIISEIAKDCD